MFELAIVLFFLALGFLTGSYFEKRHYKSIEERESKYAHIPVITGEWKNQVATDDEGAVISSGTVVASDYFKSFVSRLRNIFGGRMRSYETLLDRGRREALLRVLEKAEGWGAHKIVNVRIETSTVSASNHKKGSLPCVELFAYGTALRKRPRS